MEQLINQLNHESGNYSSPAFAGVLNFKIQLKVVFGKIGRGESHMEKMQGKTRQGLE